MIICIEDVERTRYVQNLGLLLYDHLPFKNIYLTNKLLMMTISFKPFVQYFVEIKNVLSSRLHDIVGSLNVP